VPKKEFSEEAVPVTGNSEVAALSRLRHVLYQSNPSIQMQLSRSPVQRNREL